MNKNTLYRRQNNWHTTFLQGMGGFYILWFGQIISLTGSGITCFAQSIWVYTDLGSTITHLTALAVLARLPGVLISPLAGAIADKYDRRWVMIISDTVAALATLTLRTLVVTNSFQMWHIYVVVIVISIANHFHWPAYFASISLMVPKEKLGVANGYVQMGRAIGQIAAPFTAGILITFLKIQGVFLFDLITYLVSLATLLVVPIPKLRLQPVVTGKKITLADEIVQGWNYLMERKGLLSILNFFAISNFLLGIVGVLVTPLVLSFTSAQVLGTILSIGGVAMLAGSLMMTIWSDTRRWIYGVLIFTLVQGVAIILAGLGPNLGLIIGAATVFYFATPIVNACGNVIWQRKVDPHMQGRAFAASGMVAMGTVQIGYLIAGPLADWVFEPLLAKGGAWAGSIGQFIGVGPGRGIGLIFIIFGLLCVLLTVYGFFNPRIRKLDTEMADALPDQKKAPVGEATIFPGDLM